MNQGKIWLVVNPTVGLPAFLGGVALISLAVHAAVLTHTDWYPAIYNGKAHAKTAAVQTAPAVAQQTPSAAAVAPAGGTVVAVAGTSLAGAAAPPGKTQ